jgi:hypothetical protein
MAISSMCSPAETRDIWTVIGNFQVANVKEENLSSRLPAGRLMKNVGSS